MPKHLLFSLLTPGREQKIKVTHCHYVAKSKIKKRKKPAEIKKTIEHSGMQMQKGLEWL